MIYVVAICYQRRLIWKTNERDDYHKLENRQFLQFSHRNVNHAHELAEREAYDSGVRPGEGWREISRTGRLIPQTPEERALLREVKPEDEKELREIERKLQWKRK